MDQPLTIRPHHGMCVAFYQGEGYSEEFVSHMDETVKRLENAMVRISSETDVICRKCPHNQNGVCRTEEKCNAYDGKVLSVCGIPEGATMPFRAFSEIVERLILDKGLREEICGDCQWNELCKKRL